MTAFIKAANKLIESCRASKPQAVYDNYVEAAKKAGINIVPHFLQDLEFAVQDANVEREWRYIRGY